jgi:hypothetical protein
VARFVVARAGENPSSSHDRDEYGRWFFEAEPQGVQYYETAGQSSADALIRDLGVKADAKVLGHSFQGGAGVRRLDQRAERQLAAHAATLDLADDLMSELTDGVPYYLSSRLKASDIYSRKILGDMLGISGSAMGAGVFRRQGTQSVLLFVTEQKGTDRTQYTDRLEDNILFWEGQEKRGTDSLIIGHEDDRLELLVFYRRRKNEFPDYGFRYLGSFEYVSHETSPKDEPTRFVLKRITIAKEVAVPLSPTEGDAESFNPSSVEDARETVSRQIKARRGQKEFRDNLLAAYGRRCAITGCAVLDVLEAAHIHPYRGNSTNHSANGLLLRADLHTLLDCGLIAVDPDSLRVTVASSIRTSSYGKLEGRPLRQREKGWPAASTDALRLRFDGFRKQHET